MALLTHDYYCPELGFASELRIVIPGPVLQGDEESRGMLFLLPPEGESGLSLLTGTKISALCNEYLVTAVIPPCLQGCYTDMAYGYPFYRSLKNVREYLKIHLPGIPVEGGNCAIAGIGIGGLGALRFALEEPDYFSCAGSIAGLTDPAMPAQGYFTEKRLRDLFGEKEERAEMRDQFLMECRAASKGRFYLFSAKEDPGFEASCRTADALGNRAMLHLTEGHADLKTVSDQLGEFMKFYLGGDR